VTVQFLCQCCLTSTPLASKFLRQVLALRWVWDVSSNRPPAFISHHRVSNIHPFSASGKSFKYVSSGTKLAQRIRVLVSPTSTTSGTCWRRRLDQARGALVSHNRVRSRKWTLLLFITYEKRLHNYIHHSLIL
jgi:hypothetical protein